MRIVMILGLILLIEPAMQSQGTFLLLAALGLIKTIFTLVVAKSLIRRRRCEQPKIVLTKTDIRQTDRSVLEIARENRLSQDAVKQMTRGTQSAGQTALSGKACRIQGKSREQVAMELARRRSVSNYTATA